jgi:hypothetical protein
LSDRLDRRIALALAVATTAILLFASRNQGFTRDEGYYFDAGEQYWQWYAEVAEGLAHGNVDGLREKSVDRWWSYNHEHPPLMKVLYGVSWRIFHKCDCPAQGGRHPIGYSARHRTLSLLSESQAFRLPAFLMGGLLVALVYLFGAHAVSRRAGLVAAALALAMPRYFFHAQLSCFDAPMATTWLLTVYCYWRSLTDPRFALPAGISFGLALATKHNGFFIPILLVAHYLYVRRDALRALRFPPIPRAFVWMALLGPLVEFALWPWMWFHTVDRVREYFQFHLQHVHYNFEYLGVNYNNPPYPKSYPFVMTLLTAPVTTMVLALVGAVAFALGRQIAERVERRAAAEATRHLPPPAAGLCLAPGAGRGRAPSERRTAGLRRARSGNECRHRSPLGDERAGAAGDHRRHLGAHLRRDQALAAGHAIRRAARRRRRRGDVRPAGLGIVDVARARGDRLGCPVRIPGIARRARDAALAPLWPVPLQPARGRTGRRRRPGNEPPVLGIFLARRAVLAEPARAPERQRLLA